MRASLPEEIRFEALCSDPLPNGCRLWQGRTTKPKGRHLGGYGQFRARDPETGLWTCVYAHRYALARKLGRPIRTGYDADHECRNRSCVAEHHLVERPARPHRAIGQRKVRTEENLRAHLRKLWKRDELLAQLEAGLLIDRSYLEFVDRAIEGAMNPATLTEGPERSFTGIVRYDQAGRITSIEDLWPARLEAAA